MFWFKKSDFQDQVFMALLVDMKEDSEAEQAKVSQNSILMVKKLIAVTCIPILFTLQVQQVAKEI